MSIVKMLDVHDTSKRTIRFGVEVTSPQIHGNHKTHNVAIEITSNKITDISIGDASYFDYDIDALVQIVNKIVEIQESLK